MARPPRKHPTATATTSPEEVDETTFRNILHFAGSNIYRQLLGLVTTFIRPRLLSPEMFGLWSLLNIIPTWGTHLHLGARSAMRFRIPFHSARGEEPQVTLVKGAAYYGPLLLKLPAALAMILAAFAWPGLGIEERVGLGVASIILLINWHQDFHISLLKGRENFRLVSATSYTQTTAVFVLTLLLIPPFGFYGAIGALALGTLFTTVHLWWRHGIEPVGTFHFATFRQLVREGFPIMIMNLMAALLRSIDKVIIAAMLGNRALGYYGVATMVSGALMSLPGVSREVMEPRLMAAAAADRDLGAELARRHFIRPITTTAYLMPFLIGPAFVLIGPFIHLFLPRYEPGIEATRIVILGTHFLAMAYPARGILVAHNRQIAAVWAGLGAAATTAILGILAVKAGFDIEGVAVAATLGFVAFAALLFQAVVSHCGLTRDDIGPALFHTLMPFLVSLIAAVAGVTLLERLEIHPLLQGGIGLAGILSMAAALLLSGYHRGVVTLPRRLQRRLGKIGHHF
ncbi:MAG: oligosaccharide flippase family protein [Magnetococcales bacterium]|nr:oligosaccharide flippase family protein [Magnetococcales bacterium]MBF0156926.1 oligosaccharide flippase family protein [Magnetococcales bacterium]